MQNCPAALSARKRPLFIMLSVHIGFDIHPSDGNILVYLFVLLEAGSQANGAQETPAAVGETELRASP